MVWSFRPQSPPRAGRHRSSSPGRGPAAPPPHPLHPVIRTGQPPPPGPPPPPGCAHSPPAQPHAWQSPGCPNAQHLLAHPLPREPPAARFLPGLGSRPRRQSGARIRRLRGGAERLGAEEQQDAGFFSGEVSSAGDGGEAGGPSGASCAPTHRIRVPFMAAEPPSPFPLPPHPPSLLLPQMMG